MDKRYFDKFQTRILKALLKADELVGKCEMGESTAIMVDNGCAVLIPNNVLVLDISGMRDVPIEIVFEKSETDCPIRTTGNIRDEAIGDIVEMVTSDGEIIWVKRDYVRMFDGYTMIYNSSCNALRVEDKSGQPIGAFNPVKMS